MFVAADLFLARRDSCDSYMSLLSMEVYRVYVHFATTRCANVGYIFVHIARF